MSTVLWDLFREVRLDPLREKTPFSDEISTAQERILAVPPEHVAKELAAWLAKWQPCLFGRIAARQGLLSFCVLTEDHLRAGDSVVREAIQAARLAWTADAFRGKKSGFVILVQSRTLASAAPDKTLQAFSQRLASLYLLEDVEVDSVHTDEVFLEAPSDTRATWRWDAGVNFFGAQGDGRWWQDHRIPGGIAFSINSVGHMVKSGALSRAMAALGEALALEMPDQASAIVDTLPKALELAMRTIHMAANTPWGPATELMPMPSDPSVLAVPKCPAALPPFLRDKNHCEYLGWYHTDQTVPSLYFDPSRERTSTLRYTLDFTYLFDSRVDNPDHARMGVGVRVRAGDRERQKVARAEAVTVDPKSSRRLVEALERHPAE